jgi:hypothetical protein
MRTEEKMSRPSSRNSRVLDPRTELVLALSEARRLGEKTLSEAPEFLRGYVEGMTVAIEIVRALDAGPTLAIDRRRTEIR